MTTPTPSSAASTTDQAVTKFEQVSLKHIYDESLCQVCLKILTAFKQNLLEKKSLVFVQQFYNADVHMLEAKRACEILSFAFSNMVFQFYTRGKEIIEIEMHLFGKYKLSLLSQKNAERVAVKLLKVLPTEQPELWALFNPKQQEEETSVGKTGVGKTEKMEEDDDLEMV